MMQRFRDRADAGRQLAQMLTRFAGRDDLIVLGLPRGGVPVAFEVAHALSAPMDVFVVRKLGFPGHEELAMGAIASGAQFIDREVLERYPVPEAEIERVVRAEQQELERRERLYRDNRPAPDLQGKTVLLVDDGLATGSSMRVAVKALRAAGATRIVVAVPVASPDTCAAFRDIVDDIVCLATPEPFYAVGLWYEDFSQTTDEEVHDLLGRSGSGTVA